MTKKINGANLGGWLVLEKWMAPHVFEGVQADDEYYLPQDLSREAYETRIQMHRNSFITEGDFLRLHSNGFTHVRIPVPYFIFGDRPPFIGCVEELDKAFSWATSYDLKILIDVHTAPMSQNGFDNGGISGVCKWAQLPKEVDFELTVLERLAQRYGQNEALYGIEVLNEPVTEVMWHQMNPTKRFPARDAQLAAGTAPMTLDFLQQYYDRAYHIMKPYLAADKKIVFHDAFELHAWKNFFETKKYDNVILDTHQYLMMAEMNGTAQSLDAYLDFIAHLQSEIETVAHYVDVFVGEWCLFNSYGVGLDTQGGMNPTQVDFEGNTRLSHEELEHLYQTLWSASLEAWNVSLGHFYWTYKLNIDTVNQPEWYGWDAWDLSRCIDHHWITH